MSLYRARMIKAGLADLPLRISSYQFRKRQSPLESYLQVVTPEIDLAGDIADRADGELVLDRWDGAAWAEVARANVESPRTDRGASSVSITIAGHKTVTYSSPVTVALQGGQTTSESTSGRRIRALPDHAIRPGDTATWGSLSFVAGLITYTGSATAEYMDVSE
ncbi:hypothetical protein PCS_02629 [Desulfocurvibacter africanus PCS]|uniref:Uncharacterized protein n=1 Tax=Desulfocurvibacter africanus PCS TaxID=1262666 RepID=M5PQJ4_DESAF|nr:hypothetical protein [Desulfocurvibacter africanus]EMG36617.1 hypothetical protein PCS_02629 [Desulfocurvibacter africanus PCS]